MVAWRRTTYRATAVLTLGSIAFAHSLSSGQTHRVSLTQIPASFSLQLPGELWSLEVDMPGFVTQRGTKPGNGRAVLMAQNDQTGMVASIFMERKSGRVTSQACRDAYWVEGQKTPYPKSDVELSDPGALSLIKWRQKEHRGVRIDQQHMHAFLGRDDVCIELHLSKVRFRPGDEQLFGEIFRSVRFNERLTPSRPSPAASDYLGDLLPQEFAIPSHGRLTLNLPKIWQASLRQISGAPPTIAIVPTEGEPFTLLITVMWPNTPSKHSRTLVESVGRAALTRAVEKTLKIQQFGFGEKTGYYFKLTDRSPKPHEYRFLTQGAVAEGSLLLAFTFLTNSKVDGDERQALNSLVTAKQVL